MKLPAAAALFAPDRDLSGPVKSSYPLDEDLEALGRLLIISGLFLLGLATAGGLFLSSWALRPVHQITTTLREISGSNLDIRIKEENFDRELIPLVHQLKRRPRPPAAGF